MPMAAMSLGGSRRRPPDTIRRRGGRHEDRWSEGGRKTKIRHRDTKVKNIQGKSTRQTQIQ